MKFGGTEDEQAPCDDVDPRNMFTPRFRVNSILLLLLYMPVLLSYLDQMRMFPPDEVCPPPNMRLHGLPLSPSSSRFIHFGFDKFLPKSESHRGLSVVSKVFRIRSPRSWKKYLGLSSSSSGGGGGRRSTLGAGRGEVRPLVAGPPNGINRGAWPSLLGLSNDGRLLEYLSGVDDGASDPALSRISRSISAFPSLHPPVPKPDEFSSLSSSSTPKPNTFLPFP